MSEYYNEKTKKVGSWSDIVSANPNTSFPPNPSEDIAKNFCWEILHHGEIPAITSVKDLSLLRTSPKVRENFVPKCREYSIFNNY